MGFPCNLPVKEVVCLLSWWQWWGWVTLVFSETTPVQGGRILIVVGVVVRVSICNLLVDARRYGDARLSPQRKRVVPGLQAAAYELLVALVTVQAPHFLILVQGLCIRLAAGRSGEQEPETCRDETAGHLNQARQIYWHFFNQNANEIYTISSRKTN